MPSTNPDPGPAELLSELSDGVLTLTLNRPESRNAMTGAMIEALGNQLEWAESDRDIRCVVLTGSGKGFCAGGDVKGMASEAEAGPSLSTDEFIAAQRRAQHATAGRLFKMPKPTLAVVNGAAAGAGLSLALACDLRIMSTAAVLTTAFAKVGLAGDWGGTYYMTQLVGPAKTKELYYLSERVDAAAALAAGLVNWTCEPGELAAKSSELARRLANGPGVAFRYMKENINRALTPGHDDALDVEATHHVHSFATEDNKAAVEAFVAKREPVFRGR